MILGLWIGSDWADADYFVGTRSALHRAWRVYFRAEFDERHNRLDQPELVMDLHNSDDPERQLLPMQLRNVYKSVLQFPR